MLNIINMHSGRDISITIHRIRINMGVHWELHVSLSKKACGRDISITIHRIHIIWGILIVHGP